MIESLRHLLHSASSLLISAIRNRRLFLDRIRQIWATEGLEGFSLRSKRWTGKACLYEPLPPTAKEKEEIAANIDRFHYLPLISILTPVHDVDEPWLRNAIDSVVSQYYPHWELCIADDMSSKPYIPEMLKEYAAKDPRIRFELLTTHHHISETSNVALSMARGEYVALLDHDDELAPDALFHVVKLLNRHPEADMIYSDEDHIHPTGKHTNPVFKPDWAPDLFLSHMYTCHLGVFRRSLLVKIGGFRKGYEGSQDYDLVLRLLLHDPKIFHLPRILYHWRMSSTSVAGNPFSKTYADEAALRAIQDYLKQSGQDAIVERGKLHLTYRARYRIRNPLQTAIVLHGAETELLRSSIESICGKTAYSQHRIYVAASSTDAPDSIQELGESGRAVVLRYPGTLNFAAVSNFAVSQTTEPILLFLAAGMEAIHPEWLTAMVEHVQRPEVGIVGARLHISGANKVRVGIILNPNSPFGYHPLVLPAKSPAHLGRSLVVHNVSGVTGACLMTRRDVFDAVGGFDAENFPTCCGDVDFCLKVRRAGYRIVFTPYAEMLQRRRPGYEYGGEDGKSARLPREASFFREKWAEAIQDGDRCFRLPNGL